MQGVGGAEPVHLWSFEFPGEEFLAGVPAPLSSRVVRHDGFQDPLRWHGDGKPRPFSDLFSARRIRDSLGGSVGGAVTVVIDSLSWLVWHLPLPSLCRTLRDLSHTPHGSPHLRLVMLLHSDLHGGGVLHSLCSLADWLLDVGAGPGNIQSVAIIQRRKSGKVVIGKERVRVLEDLSLLLITEENQSQEPSKAQVDPAENLTFNLRLSEAEREKREAAHLPYTFTDSKKLSLLQQGAGGSAKIFYDPEPSDDLDDEDPDDDLDV
ncbi:elongator complex protein 5 [Gastrophryne carolinensis]